MEALPLLVRLKTHKIALNHALILLYVKAHPGCFQKEMAGEIGMSRNVLCTVMQLLLAKRLIVQSGTYTNKQHTLSAKGEVECKKIVPDGIT